VIVLAEAGTTWSMHLRYGGAVPATTTEPMARTLRVSRSRPGMLVSAGESAWRIVLWFAFRTACHLPGVAGTVVLFGEVRLFVPYGLSGAQFVAGVVSGGFGMRLIGTSLLRLRDIITHDSSSGAR
jgi:hypothetical protein